MAEKKKTVYFTTGLGYFEWTKIFQPVKYDKNIGEKGGSVPVEPGDRESFYQLNFIMTGKESEDMKKLCDDMIKERQKELGSKVKLRWKPYKKWEPKERPSNMEFDDGIVFEFKQRGDFNAPCVYDMFGDDKTTYLKENGILIGNGSTGLVRGSFWLPSPKDDMFTVRLQFQGIQLKDLVKHQKKMFSEIDGTPLDGGTVPAF
jgi:hypothetical protein